MNPTHVLARRPLIAAVAGLLLVSACGTAADSTSAPTLPTTDIVIDRAPETTQAAPAPNGTDVVASTTPSATPMPTPTPTPSTSEVVAVGDQPMTTPPPASTTVPPTTSPPVTEPPAVPAPVAVVDVSGGTVFGIGVFESVDVDAVIGDVSARLGSPTTDSGWQPSAGQSCAGSTDVRVLWWGDLRMTFERYQGDDGTVRDELSAWTVGDPTVFGLAPIGEVPEPSPSNIVTMEGIGLGSSLAHVEAAWSNINNGGDDRLVVVDRGGLLTIRLDHVDGIVGFGDGPFDCPVDETH